MSAIDPVSDRVEDDQLLKTLAIECASRAFLTSPLTAEVQSRTDEEILQFIMDNTWEPLANTSEEDVYSYIHDHAESIGETFGVLLRKNHHYMPHEEIKSTTP